ncbi:MAG: chemotaxis protein CheB [Gloeobacteraceae cyanobacterium ES-bin-316]|nr:chemotaxis protein CheB [Ferruginibacter sp.]
MKHPKFITVVGTSAGGMSALIELVSQLREDMDTAVLIVMHLSGTGISDFLVHRLQPHSSFKCKLAVDGASIERGCIYVATAHVHLLVKENAILIGRGPEENRWRPSIDVLFRSAAVAYNTRCIGIVLTGLLDDGTTGMFAIKRSGGCCIVQDPNEAEYPDMPLSVLDHMEVDYCVPLQEMGNILATILKTTPASKKAPEEIIIESEIAERVVVDYDNVARIAEKSIYACPDCGGGLWEMTKAGNDKVIRYRCHIGHSYSEKDLVIKQGEIFESTLWVALRMMEERRNLLIKLETDHLKKGLAVMAKSYKTKADTIQGHVDKMKEVLFSSQRLN